jgi:hypothetical protein
MGVCQEESAARLGVQKPHLEYIRGLQGYRSTVVQMYGEYRKMFFIEEVQLVFNLVNKGR